MSRRVSAAIVTKNERFSLAFLQFHFSHLFASHNLLEVIVDFFIFSDVHFEKF